eukprot:TRINITY_DN1374_c0_g2_i1.p1 TRINITY_DN1374_c0_g2~~TRINITY_DN1374_c0_g2_i1.p1  ORF type:complete len:120 (+),score=27.64 TRINITY_DN1374_c0_g2_i1:102-461(+)
MAGAVEAAEQGSLHDLWDAKITFAAAETTQAPQLLGNIFAPYLQSKLTTTTTPYLRTTAEALLDGARPSLTLEQLSAAIWHDIPSSHHLQSDKERTRESLARLSPLMSPDAIASLMASE